MILPKVVEIKGLRVLTTEQLAASYGTKPKILQYNFSYNKKRYTEGKHYIALQGEELRTFKADLEIQGNLKYAHTLYLWTEKGALLHAKSLNTDKAWEVYDYLVDFYFRAKEKIQEVQPKPVKKPSGSEVVDIPENLKIQTAMQEMRKKLIAIDTALKAYNRYQCKESYLHLERALHILWIEAGREMNNLMEIEPNLVIKPGY